MTDQTPRTEAGPDDDCAECYRRGWEAGRAEALDAVRAWREAEWKWIHVGAAQKLDAILTETDR